MTHGAGARRAVRRHRRTLSAAVVTSFLVAGCAGSDDAATSTTSGAPSSSVATAPAPKPTAATSSTATSSTASSTPPASSTTGSTVPGPTAPTGSGVDAAIRGVDFRNGFTYGIEGLPPFQVTDGRAAQGTPGTPDATAFLVRDVDYGDFDGDGREEAAVSTLYDGGGTGKFTSVWVYQLTATSIRRVATSPGGDRGDGGVADVSVADGVLVVDNFDRPQGACCPTAMTRHRYRLRGDTLVDTTAPTTLALVTVADGGSALQFLPGTSGAVLRNAGETNGATVFDAAAGQRLVVTSRSSTVTVVLRQGGGASDPILSQGSALDVRLPTTGTYRLDLLLSAGLDVFVDISIT